MGKSGRIGFYGDGIIVQCSYLIMEFFQIEEVGKIRRDE